MSPEAIVREVAAEYLLTVDEMGSRSRRADLIEARREAFYRLWRETDLTLAQIGAVLGRNYSTVCHHLRMRELRERAA